MEMGKAPAAAVEGTRSNAETLMPLFEQCVSTVADAKKEQGNDFVIFHNSPPRTTLEGQTALCC